MKPMTVHYALHPVEEGAAGQMAEFMVEIEGGVLSTCCLVPDPDPAMLGNMAGMICGRLHADAGQFPGDNRNEQRTVRQVIQFATGQVAGLAAPRYAQFDVMFTPNEQEEAGANPL